MARNVIDLVSSLDEARDAVLAFGPAVEGSPDLATRLAYHRAWIAMKADGSKGEGGWRYAPSRWAGHRGIDAGAYLSAGAALDGRRSDAVLATWFAPVADPKRQAKHMRRLRELFARHGAGQAPNARTRFLEVAVPAPDGDRDDERRLVELLAAVFRSLSVPSQAALRKRIG